MSYDVEINLMGLGPDAVSEYRVNSYEEAINLIVRDGKEFAEFPLDDNTSELIDLFSGISSTSEELELIEISNSKIEEILLSIKQNFKFENMPLSELVASKIFEVSNNILEKNNVIRKNTQIELSNNRFVLGSEVFKQAEIGWHSDASIVDGIKIVIPLKGPGTLYCNLAQENKKDFLVKNLDYLNSYSTNKYNEMSEFLNKACTQENKNIYQVQPHHALMFKSGKDVAAIHSSPNFIGERMVIRMEFNYAVSKAAV
jgi:hypothetical protein